MRKVSIVALLAAAAAFDCCWRNAIAQDCAYLAANGAPGWGSYNGTWLLRTSRGSLATALPDGAVPASACAPEPAAQAPLLRLQGYSTITPTPGVTLGLDYGRVIVDGAPQGSVQLVHKPASQCTRPNTGVNADGTCNDRPALNWQLSQALGATVAQGALMFWFRGSIAMDETPVAIPLVALQGPNPGGPPPGSITVWLGTPTAARALQPGGSANSLTSTVTVELQLNSGARLIWHAWVNHGVTTLLDGRWHSIVLVQQGDVGGCGLLLIDGQPVHLAPLGMSSAQSAVSYWLNVFGGASLITVGGTTDWATGVGSYAGGFDFRSLTLWSGPLSICQAQTATAVEAGALDAVAIKGGNDVAPTAATSGFVRTYATSYFGYDLWAGTTGGAGSQLLLIRLGWYPLLTLDDTDATVSSFAAAGGTDASGQQYMLTAAVTTTDLAALAGKVATGGGGMQAVFYCVKGSQDDGSFIQDTYLPAFTDCRSWQAATPTLLGDLLALNCSACQGSSCVNMSEPTAEEVREQQVQQATSSFETQRQAATAVSAATVAVATAGSAAASAAVSSMAAQAAAALGAMGAQVGMEGALASIGISGLVNHLQMFALSGSFNTNLSATYINLASALEWTNFQFMSSSSDAAVAAYEANLDQAAAADGTVRRRRLHHSAATYLQRRQLQQSIVGYLQSGQQLAGEYAMKVESLQEAVWGSAIPRLITVMVLGVAMLMLHWLTLFLWGRVGFLKARPLPAELVFPKLEIAFLEASMVAVAQSMGMLLAAGTVSGSVNCIVVGVVAFCYAAGLLTALTTVAQRIFWHLGDFELRYSKPEVEVEDKEGRRVVFARLTSLRFHGEWGGGAQAKLLDAVDFEPARTQYYITTSISPLALMRLIWRKRTLQRAVDDRIRQRTLSKKKGSLRIDSHKGAKAGQVAPLPTGGSHSKITARGVAEGHEPHNWQQEEQRLQQGSGSSSDPGSPDGRSPGAQRGMEGGSRSPAMLSGRHGSGQVGSREGSFVAGAGHGEAVAEVHLVKAGGESKGSGAKGEPAPAKQAVLDAASIWSQEAAEEAELQRVSMEISERLGDLFEDFRGHSPWTAGFKMFEMVYRIAVAIVVGLMTGLSVQGDATAAGLLWGLFAMHTLYALLLTTMRPFVDALRWATEACSLWLEALMVLCSALLIYSPDNETYQDVMLYASLSAVGVQLLSVLAGLMFQLLLSIRVRKRIQQVVVQYQEVVKQQEAAKKARPAPPRVSPPPPPREFPVYRTPSPQLPVDDEESVEETESAHTPSRPKQYKPPKPKVKEAWAPESDWKMR